MLKLYVMTASIITKTRFRLVPDFHNKRPLLKTHHRNLMHVCNIDVAIPAHIIMCSVLRNSRPSASPTCTITQPTNALSASRAPYLRALDAKKSSRTSLYLVTAGFANTITYYSNIIYVD